MAYGTSKEETKVLRTFTMESSSGYTADLSLRMYIGYEQDKTLQRTRVRLRMNLLLPSGWYMDPIDGEDSYIKVDGKGINGGTDKASIYFDGSTIAGSDGYVRGQAWIGSTSRTFIIDHNKTTGIASSDGKIKIDWGFTGRTDSSFSDLNSPSGSFTFSIPKIESPVTSIKSITGGIIDEDIQVQINQTTANKNYEHHFHWYLEKAAGNTSAGWKNMVTLKKGVTSAKLNLKPIFYSHIAAGNTSGKLKIRCLTYTEGKGTLIGTSNTIEHTIKLSTEKCKPTLSIDSLTDFIFKDSSNKKFNPYSFKDDNKTIYVLKPGEKIDQFDCNFTIKYNNTNYRTYGNIPKTVTIYLGNNGSTFDLGSNSPPNGKSGTLTGLNSTSFQLYVKDGKGIQSDKVTVQAPIKNYQNPTLEFEPTFIVNQDTNLSSHYIGIEKLIIKGTRTEIPNSGASIKVDLYDSANNSINFTYKKIIDGKEQDVTGTSFEFDLGESSNTNFSFETPKINFEREVNETNEIKADLYKKITLKATFYTKATDEAGYTFEASFEKEKLYNYDPVFSWSDEDFQFNIPVNTKEVLNAQKINAEELDAQKINAEELVVNKTITLPKNADFKLKEKTGGSLDMNNGDIFKANRIVFADYSQANASEGLVFPRSSGSNYDILRVLNGVLKILPNYDGGDTYPTEQVYYPYKPYYGAGDSIKFANNDAQWAGHLTGSSKELFFTIPLDKPVEASNFSISGHIECRGGGGSDNGNQYLYVKEQASSKIKLTGSGVSVTSKKISPSGLSMRIVATSGFFKHDNTSNLFSNNCPVTVEPHGDTSISATGISISFS